MTDTPVVPANDAVPSGIKGMIDKLVAQTLVYGRIRIGHPQEEDFLAAVKAARATLDSAIATLLWDKPFGEPPGSNQQLASDRLRGIYKRHDGGRYFVLDAKHDPYAAVALRAYAKSCEAEHPMLAADLWLLSRTKEELDNV